MNFNLKIELLKNLGNYYVCPNYYATQNGNVSNQITLYIGNINNVIQNKYNITQFTKNDLKYINDNFKSLLKELYYQFITENLLDLNKLLVISRNSVDSTKSKINFLILVLALLNDNALFLDKDVSTLLLAKLQKIFK
jgi:hypothetical protein